MPLERRILITGQQIHDHSLNWFKKLHCQSVYSVFLMQNAERCLSTACAYTVQYVVNSHRGVSAKLAVRLE